MSWLFTLLACADGASTDDVKLDGTTDEQPPGPLVVTGWGEDQPIALGDADSQGEPTVTAMPDGSVIAAWMSLDGYSLYIRYSISKDGGKTWSSPEYIDKDRYGYQNDPVLVYGGGYLYFTWLAVEGSSYNKSNIYCVDSTDGGATWSDKVQLTDSNTFNDRQWMDVDSTGRAIITWDKFGSNNSESQSYAESEGGCAGFGEENGTTVFDGILLNGVPAFDANGDIWISRHQFTSRAVNVVVQKKVDGGWGDEVVLHHGTYPGYFTAQATAEHEAEHDEGEEGAEGEADQDALEAAWRAHLAEFGEEYAPELYGQMEEELAEQRRPPWQRGVRDMDRMQWRNQKPTATVSGDYTGTYSPMVKGLPDGSLVAVAMDLADGTSDQGVVWFLKYDGKDTVTETELVDSGGTAQQEPWLTVDPQGGIHTIWYDAREGQWRLRGASSVDGGETFTEFDIGDTTMKKGFDDYDANSWVGHFQGVSAWEDGIVTVFGDNSEGKTSYIHADFATFE